MSPYRELDFFSKLVILFGGFYVQFGLVFFNVGVWVGVVMRAFLYGQEPIQWLMLLHPLIFGTVGGIFVYIGLRRNLKALQLLQYGIITTGKLEGSEYTNTKINNAPEIKYIFSFQADGKTYRVSGKTHEQQLIQAQERIIYNPDNPDFAIVYDLIPSIPELEDGLRFRQLPYYKVYLFVLPAIAFAGLSWLLGLW